MNIQELQVRNVHFGEGIPKICVPVVEKTKEEILSQIEKVLVEEPDLIEIRMDWFEKATDKEAVRDLLRNVRTMAGDMVILFTIRTSTEGGELTISTEEYKQLCCMACESGCVDLLDVEAFMQEGLLKQISEAAHRNGVYVIASNHDFHKTPPKEEIERRLEYMIANDADIAKIAVMPLCEEDVDTLIRASEEYYAGGNEKPIITMSMGELGRNSRIMGEKDGSVVTFASLGQASAPGQIPIRNMKELLAQVHQSC